MKIAVIGANGRTWRIVVEDALARGHQVVAVTRADGVSPRDDDNLETHAPGSVTRMGSGVHWSEPAPSSQRWAPGRRTRPRTCTRLASATRLAPWSQPELPRSR
jgi:hypothetical protein